MAGSEYYNDDYERIYNERLHAKTVSVNEHKPNLPIRRREDDAELVRAAEMILEAKREEDNLDPNVKSVCDKYKQRARTGFEKYGTNTTRTDLNTLEWLTHLQEELMDATIYIERVKQDLEGM
jgi:hypothetical protein